MGDVKEIVKELREYGDSRKGEISNMTKGAADVIERLSKSFEYVLERKEGENFYEWGKYNVTVESELKAMLEAAQRFHDTEIRVVRV